MVHMWIPTFLLTPKVSMSSQGKKNGFWVVSSFLEGRKHSSFLGILFLFHLVTRNKNYAIQSSNGVHQATKQKSQNNKTIFLKFFSRRKYFCLHQKICFIPFGLKIRKLWKILFFTQSNHLLQKITFKIHFKLNFYNFSKNQLHMV